VQEIPIKPLIVRIPGERIVERFYQPVERQTEPLPTIHIEMPATPPSAAPHITVNVPERTRDERQNVPEQNQADDDSRNKKGRTIEPEMDVPPMAHPPVREQEKAPSNEQKQFGPVDKNNSEPEQKPNKTHSGDEQKSVPPDNEINSETIPGRNEIVPPLELIEPDKPAPQADSEEFEKIGPGRQRKYEELGEKEVEPVRELVLFRNEFGRHWPGLSKDMEHYYEHFYFTAPNKRKDGKNYERHVKCWERRTKWLATTESTPGSH
jgi:hypothetical protein